MLWEKLPDALPGIGSAVNAVTELVLTTAVLVRNSLGIALLLVILAVGAGPLVRYGLLSLTYRFLAAAAQPVSDQTAGRSLWYHGRGMCTSDENPVYCGNFMYAYISDPDGRRRLGMRTELYQWMEKPGFFSCTYYSTSAYSA